MWIIIILNLITTINMFLTCNLIVSFKRKGKRRKHNEKH